MKREFRWMLCSALLVLSCGGGNGDGDGTNNASNNGAVAGECTQDEDCPAASTATFARNENVVCTASEVRGNYCSECATDSQCMTGEACRDATYCYTLPACTAGADCSDNPGEVHQACIGGFCRDCIDDADCDHDEVCYSRRCATRSTVDPTCVDATCEGPCDIEYDADNAPTGISCMP